MNIQISKKHLGLAFIIWGIFAFLMLSNWAEPIENSITNLQLKIRGERQLSDDFVFVYLGAEDINALGGWPITRDYYGYMTHALSSLGAKVIAFHILFDTPDPRFPEYDEILTGFLQNSGRVVLPFSFLSLMKGADLLTGADPVYPISDFKEKSKAVGFSNLGVDASKVPLSIVTDSEPSFSFGFEIARAFSNVELVDIPVDSKSRLHLNHFGGLDKINASGFIDVLQQFETNPDSLNFANKIVVIGITAPGLPNLFATPFSDGLPSGLIHATVAENIISKNYLREVPTYLQLVLLAALVLGIWQVTMTFGFRQAFLICVGVLAGLFVMSQIALSWGNFVVQILNPYLATTIIFIVALQQKAKQEKSDETSIKAVIEAEIAKKESELNEAQETLQTLQMQLLDQTVVSQQLNQTTEEQRQKIVRLEKQTRDLKQHVQEDQPIRSLPEFTDIICSESSAFNEVLSVVSKVAKDDIPILILGETGTGKEMIANAIHKSSDRSGKPFVAVNCGALPETLLESELFGHERGSFTGAQNRRKGRFELADGGTIFLDEITETSPAFQARLLRVLQEGTFERLGGEQTIRVNMRVIAACNKNIQAEVASEKFRSDLFYRLNGFPINLPALKERLDDIPLLASFFLKKHGYDGVSGFSEQGMKSMKSYAWPGNVRELENVVRRAAIIAQSENRENIREKDLSAEIRSHEIKKKTAPEFQSFEEQILESLRKFEFSYSAISKTAEALGNRDRGTITEHFRGICFQQMVFNNFEIEKAVAVISASSDPIILERVQNKVNEYISKLQPLPAIEEINPEDIKNLPSQFKGLPKKYHGYLFKVIEHLRT